MTTVAVSIGTKPAKPLVGIHETGPELLALNAGEQYRFSFDMGVCIGCHSCEVACAEQNGLPTGTVWRRVGEIEGGAYPATKRFHLSMACNHCLEPTCLQGCPTGAYLKLDSGIVQHQADECIGCQYCTWNCPYSVPAFQPDRRIVTKCDMCKPRLDSGFAPACVESCPTNAIGIEVVDVAAWRADHSSADAPHLPPSGITLSTTRIILPEGFPTETFAGSDHRLSPEDPHWPLLWVTLLTQLAVGVVFAALVDGIDRRGAVAGFVAGAVALPASLFHLGRPMHAWKALRGLRRSWLSREVLAFGLFSLAAAVLAVLPRPATAAVALAVGVAAIYASGRLYVVPGRPAWNTQLTIAQFLATAAVLGPPVVAALTGKWTPALQALGVVGPASQILLAGANLLRLRGDERREWRGAWRLHTERFAGRTRFRFAALVGAAVVALVGGPIGLAVAAAAFGEAVGRFLFYVTVVPLNMPGAFSRESHR